MNNSLEQLYRCIYDDETLEDILIGVGQQPAALYFSLQYYFNETNYGFYLKHSRINSSIYVRMITKTSKLPVIIFVDSLMYYL
jgi:hypothetical protein